MKNAKKHTQIKCPSEEVLVIYLFGNCFTKRSYFNDFDFIEC